jgi:hypothetical protein
MLLSRFNLSPTSCASSSTATAATAAAAAVSARVSEASADASGVTTAPAACMHALARASPSASLNLQTYLPPLAILRGIWDVEDQVRSSEAR